MVSAHGLLDRLEVERRWTAVWTRIRPSEAWATRLSWLIPSAFVLFIFVRHTIEANRVIDGVRWFWLDDDQMISMRYARNLAEGHGLVWNPGEYVEGYSNFLWTIVMALVHLLGASDAHAAVYVKAIACGLVIASIWLLTDVLASCGVRSRVVMAVAGFAVAVCPDVMYWAAAGFATPLATFLHVFVVSRILGRGRLGVWGAIALALLPLVRSDSVVLWGCDALLAFIYSERRLKTIGLLALTLIPFFGHLGFRIWYYDDIFPNTYYLKVTGRGNRYATGVRYVEQFWRRYAFLLLMAAGVAIALWRDGRKRLALAVPFVVVPIFAYSISAGGDNFRPYRFFSASMPLLIGFVAAGVTTLLVSRNKLARCMWLVLLFASVVPMHNTLEEIAKVGRNGRPPKHLVAAIWLRKNASPDASVAVIPAGVVPYYSRLRSLDVLGKCDKHIARLKQKPGAGIGHGKIDPDYTLGQEPDYVVSCRSKKFSQDAEKRAKKTDKKKLNKDYILTLLASDPFQEHYSEHSVGQKQLEKENAIFVHEDSAELKRRDEWENVKLDK